MLQRRQILKFGMGAVGGAAAGAAISAPLLAWGRAPMPAGDLLPPDHPTAFVAPPPPVVVETPVTVAATGAEIRRLALHNLHTDEKIDAVYWERGAYVPDALQAVDKVLRDHRSGDVRAIDRGLLDLLDVLAARVEAKTPFQIISGYRSAASNAKLRAASKAKQVADNSLHTKGQAVDICIEGCDLKHLNKAALSLGKGGVGFYPVSNFVHVDVGRVRSWKGT